MPQAKFRLDVRRNFVTEWLGIGTSWEVVVSPFLEVLNRHVELWTIV